MSSFEGSLGSKGTDPRLPRALGGAIRARSFFFGSGSRGGDEGGGLGTLRSCWISRLMPPPRPLLLPTAQRDGTAAAAQPSRGEGAAPVHESRACARTPVMDLGGRRYSDLAPPPPAFSPRLLSRDADAAAAASSFSCCMLQQERWGAEAEQGKGQREVAQEDREEWGGMVAGFGPFHVRAKEGLKQQQQEHSEWRMERGRGCRPLAGAFLCTAATGGNYKSLVGDGCFPCFQRVARLGVAKGEVGEVAVRDGGEGRLLAADEGGRVSNPPGTGLRDAMHSHGCRLREASFCPQRGALCVSPNIGVPSDMGSDSAAGSSQITKNNQWLHRHRWGENSKLLNCCRASSTWPVGNGSVGRPQVSVSCVGPRGLVDEASHWRLHDQHVMASAQGAACRDTIDGTAATRTSYDIPDSNAVVQQQFAIKSSFWNIERIERARIVSSFCPSLALDKGVGMKRILDPDAFVPSRKLRTQD